MENLHNLKCGHDNHKPQWSHNMLAILLPIPKKHTVIDKSLKLHYNFVCMQTSSSLRMSCGGCGSWSGSTPRGSAPIYYNHSKQSSIDTQTYTASTTMYSCSTISSLDCTLHTANTHDFSIGMVESHVNFDDLIMH